MLSTASADNLIHHKAHPEPAEAFGQFPPRRVQAHGVLLYIPLINDRIARRGKMRGKYVFGW